MTAVSVRVPGFTPSVNGLQFVNSFPHEPVLDVDTPLGPIDVGDASNGLCGGMVFVARDVFGTPGMAPIEDTQPPAPDTPLFHYIVDRLIDSFDLPHAGFLRYFEWMITPDGDTGWAPFFIRPGVAWKTIHDEWPKIRAELDAGRLCPLGLVTTKSRSPAKLGENHQVLAYGYDLDDASLSVAVYDPNTTTAAADAVRLTLSLANPTHRTPIGHNVAIANPVRGFFRVPYEYRDPSLLATP